MIKIGICLPSYNEAGNICPLIEKLLNLNLEIKICLVDDNSPDGTYKIVKEKFKKTLNKKVFLILRKKKNGRGSAVWDGIRFLKKRFKNIKIFVEMDCDFSHSIEDFKRGIRIFNNNTDVLLGSRYPNGIIINWPIQRRIFSYLANFLARHLISKKIYDYTNGFRFYNLKSVNIMIHKKPVNKGYIYLSETLSLFIKKKLRINSFPITFVNRNKGYSNTSLMEIINAFLGIFKIYINHKK